VRWGDIMSLPETAEQLLKNDFSSFEEPSHGLSQAVIPLNLKVGRWLSPLLLLVFDYLTVSLGLLISFQLRNLMIRENLLIDQFARYIYMLIPMIYISFMAFEGLYNKRLPLWEKIEKLFKVALFSTLLTTGILFFEHNANYLPRFFLGLSALICFAFLLMERYLMKRLLVVCGLWHKPVLLIGSGLAAQMIANAFKEDIQIGYKIVGNIGESLLSPSPASRKTPFLGDYAKVVEIIRRSGIKDVIIATSGMEREKILELVNRIQLHVKNVSVIPELLGMPVSNVSNVSIDALFKPRTLLLKIKNNLLSPLNRIFKRLFDIVFGGMIFLGLFPVLLVISFLIRIDSKGPVVFAHKRIGRRGMVFPCYKFRTMIPDAEKVLERHLSENPAMREEWEREFKLKNDPRITKIGRFLRRTSLDELPQLLNIIRGEMSLVGPRPIVSKEVSKYKEYITDYYMVRPGLTGLWQVSGRNDIDYESRVQMDSWYVRNWSFWMDISMLIKTVKVVLEKTGAY
jgi:Undecaprenyl-phosphate galactose phosphotransferase WbaP